MTDAIAEIAAEDTAGDTDSTFAYDYTVGADVLGDANKARGGKARHPGCVAGLDCA